jgi:hypothetical protein
LMRTSLAPDSVRGSSLQPVHCLSDGAGGTALGVGAEAEAEGQQGSEAMAEPPAKAEPKKRRKKAAAAGETAEQDPGSVPPGDGAAPAASSKRKAKPKAVAGSKTSPADAPLGGEGDKAGDLPRARRAAASPAVPALLPAFDPASLTLGLPHHDGAWGRLRHWVVFSDLHVTAKTLDTCLKVGGRGAEQSAWGQGMGRGAHRPQDDGERIFLK